MSNHRLHFSGSGDTVQARCACKKRSPYGSRQEAEMWHIAHLAEVERIKAYLGSRSISLPRQHAWFVERVEDPETPADERALWQQLAEETGAYIARKSALLAQDPLF